MIALWPSDKNFHKICWGWSYWTKRIGPMFTYLEREMVQHMLKLINTILCYRKKVELINFISREKKKKNNKVYQQDVRSAHP
jgi:hypothetical protein